MTTNLKSLQFKELKGFTDARNLLSSAQNMHAEWWITGVCSQF